MATILLRSSWQTVNIGDIAHTPGVLTALERHLPTTEVILWPRHIGNGVEEMLTLRFPNLQIVRGEINDAGVPDDPELQLAWERSDLLLHGSGPSLVAEPDMHAWRSRTSKAFGVLGVTTENPTADQSQLLQEAAFVFTRETESLNHLKSAGVSNRIQSFCPDGTFAYAATPKSSEDFLLASGLRDREFICFIPRLRYTPYYTIYGHAPTEQDRQRDAVNARFRDEDFSKMRHVIKAALTNTDFDVLLCPEMTYQTALLAELIPSGLSKVEMSRIKVRSHYWLTDEASGVYARAAGIVSFECHSPILAQAHGRPIIYLRQPTDTIKGRMWQDLGLGEWVFDIDSTSGEQIAELLFKQLLDSHYAESLTRRAKVKVETSFAAACRVIGNVLQKKGTPRFAHEGYGFPW